MQPVGIDPAEEGDVEVGDRAPDCPGRHVSLAELRSDSSQRLAESLDGGVAGLDARH
jgi:hypothetical protein